MEGTEEAFAGRFGEWCRQLIAGGTLYKMRDTIREEETREKCAEVELEEHCESLYEYTGILLHSRQTGGIGLSCVLVRGSAGTGIHQIAVPEKEVSNRKTKFRVQELCNACRPRFRFGENRNNQTDRMHFL